jgi:hypothetical protein
MPPVPSSEATENAAASETTQAKPVQQPQTLLEFVTSETADAAKFLSLAAKKPPSEADCQEALRSASSELILVEKALDLARACVKTGRRPPALVGWSGEVLRRQAPALQQWGKEETDNPAELLRKLVSWGEGQREDKEARKQVDATVALGLNLLLLQRNLSPLEATRAIWSVLRSNLGGRDKLEKRLSDTLSRAQPKGLRDMVSFVGLVDEEVSRAETARSEAVLSGQQIARERDKIKESLELQSRRIAELEELREVDRLRIAELEALLKDEKQRGAHRENTLKARSRRVIGERIGDLLSDAWEAIQIDPPEVEVTRERIDMVRNEIRKEMEWLSTSGA